MERIIRPPLLQERVISDNGRELFECAQYHGRSKSEATGNQRSDLTGKLRPDLTVGAEYHVPALDKRFNVRTSSLKADIEKVFHRQFVLAADVDSSEEGQVGL